jgi:hypothetical protein
MRKTLLATAVLAAAHTAAWMWATGQLRTELDAWVAERQAEGWTVRHGATSRGGWPLAASLVVEQPDVTAPPGVSWTGERVVLRVALLRPDLLSVSPQGGQTVRLGASDLMRVQAGALSVDVSLASTGPATLLARALRVEAAGLAFTAGLLTGEIAASGADAAFTLAAEAVTLPADRRWALGERVSSASVEGRVIGIADAAGPRAWRDAGGAVELRRFAIGWGPLGASGSARGDLDAALQPEGDATVRLVGADAALDAAAADGAVTAQAAAAGKAVLGLLAAAQDSGGRVQVPVSLRAGTLSAAGVPLARVPALETVLR